MQKITPEIASRMLEKNEGNRPLKKAHVTHLAEEIKAGRWKVNGDTICLNGDRLIDGQHRLAAVIECGKSIETLVVSGLSSDVFDTKDVGARRSGGDTLAILGEKYGTNLAATICLIDQYITGRMTRVVRYHNTQLPGLLKKYPEARKCFPKCHETRRLLPASVLGACYYLFAQKDEEAADEFVKDLISGAGLKETDSVYLLRERLMNNLLGKHKMQRRYLVAITIKAWNFRRRGNECRKLYWAEGGKKQESFPVVE